MKRVKFWSRIAREKYDEWMLVEGWDESRVPVSAWKAANKAFWEWKTKNAFYPVDELEAYQFISANMIRAAENPPELERASLSTYLVATAFKNLIKHKERVVDKKRQEYRTMFDHCRVSAADESTTTCGEDKSDREWTSGNRMSLDVQAFAEALPGIHSADGVHAALLAADTVYTTLAKLDKDAQRGLRAWLEADGVWIDAAKLYDENGSVQGYVYRFKHLWAPAFRAACEWIW